MGCKFFTTLHRKHLFNAIFMVQNKQDARISIKICMPSFCFVWIILITIVTKTRSRVSPEVKLIHPLDFQLCVLARLSLLTPVFEEASICIPKAKSNSFGFQLHMKVILVLRINQHVYGLAQSIKLIKSQVQVSKRQRNSFHIDYIPNSDFFTRHSNVCVIHEHHRSTS